MFACSAYIQIELIFKERHVNDKLSAISKHGLLVGFEETSLNDFQMKTFDTWVSDTGADDATVLCI